MPSKNCNVKIIVATISVPNNLILQFFPSFTYCLQYNFQVSWLRRRPGEDDPVLMGYGQHMFVSDVRFSINRIREDWVLEILHTKSDDEALYECQVSTEPPQIHKIFLAVEGKI